MSRLRLALAQYPVGEPTNWAEARSKLSDWVASGASAGAQLLVFPEYAAMELAAMFEPDLRRSLSDQLEALQGLLPAYLDLHQELAQKHGVYIVAGSFPVFTDGKFVNRAHLFAPSGQTAYQDKQIMTRFERETWRVSTGTGLKLFETEIGRIGICICYDVEFPLLARALVQAGAQMLVVPSCTDTAAGYWRVRVGAQARALENQCLVLHSPLVGEALWSPAVDLNVGRAGVYCPPDIGLPDNGALALGEWNKAEWLHCTVDLTAIDFVRQGGQVLNHRDWDEQGKTALPPVQTVTLR